METRQSINIYAMSWMTVLCLTWGLQQVVLKAVIADLPPVLHIALRSGISMLLVIGVMLWRRERWDLTRHGKAGLLAGVFFTVEFIFVGTALHYTNASHAVVLLYTAPIFAAIGLHWRLPAERLHPLQWLGIGLAFAGIVFTFSGKPTANLATSHILWGDFLALLSGFCWAATTVVVRTTTLATAPATETLFYQLICAFFGLLLAAWLLGDFHFRSTPLVWSGLLFQGIIVSFASFLIWFGLLKRFFASQLGVFSFLTPLFGIGFGVWLLDETLEPRFMLGAVCVLAGILLVSGSSWLVQSWARLKQAT